MDTYVSVNISPAENQKGLTFKYMRMTATLLFKGLNQMLNHLLYSFQDAIPKVVAFSTGTQL